MGERLLTTPNPEAKRDKDLLERLGMRLCEVPRVLSTDSTNTSLNGNHRRD
jgi:hypothetical protein